MTTAELEARGWMVLRRRPDVWERKGERVLVLDGLNGWYISRFPASVDEAAESCGPFATLADAVRAAEGGSDEG